MSDSSDTEEFYDAEEFISVRSSKRSSICSKTISVTDSPEPDKDRNTTAKSGDVGTIAATSTPAPITPEDDRNTVKNVVQGRRRFQELRRCMQTEEEDEIVPDSTGSVDYQTFASEHPFKIISHDTMSLQSMTSLGRIGRILSGAAESHPNIRDAGAPPSTSSREPSTTSDDPGAGDRNQNTLAWCEPDVIASTKANSLKQTRASPAAIVAVSGCAPPAGSPASPAGGVGPAGGTGPAPPAGAPPAAPTAPPRRKRNKLHGSQSLSTTDGDNISVCTTDTDEYRYIARRSNLEKPQLENLVVEPLSNTSNQSMALPSPASTIESLTREFQDSLELSQAKYANELSSRSAHDRSNISASAASRRDSHLDTKKTPRGGHGMEEERVRTHSEGRVVPPSGAAGAGAGPMVGAGAEVGAAGGGPAGAARRSGPRRRSAGDERLALGAGGGGSAGAGGGTQRLTDLQILDQVTVLNLDTGERMPLSEAEHKLPQCINPLSLHIMRLTSEYIGRTNDDENTRETDEESESVCVGGVEDEAKEKKSESTDRQTTAIKKKTEKPTNSNLSKVKSHSQDNINKKLLTNELNDRLRRFLGHTVRRTVEAARSLAAAAAEVSQARHKEDVAEVGDDVRADHALRLRASASHRGPYDFEGCVRHVQEMSSRTCDHTGAVWCCKFSVCGRLLATAGQDKLLRVWVTRDAYHMFQDMRTKYNAEQKCSPTPSQESLASLPGAPPSPEEPPPTLSPAAPFCPRPFCVYSGHTSDLLDVSWSKNYFLLSSSMDKTVRLWHISRGECLCCFQHIDFVTAIVFHPRDDRYFLSGSLDGKLRLWNIPDKKVAVWNEVDGKTKLITAANFCQNGKFAVVGTYDGRCIFYTTDQLKYHTQIDVRSTRGKNSTGRKISGIEPMPNDDKILITSNDSRIRLYDLRDLNLSCKYKGYVNVSSQIKASFSHDGKYIVSGSENQCIYIWKTYHDYAKFTSVRRDRNDFWEGIKAHNAVVTCAVFAPNPDHMIRMINEREEEARLANKEDDKEDEMRPAEGGMVSSSQTGHVLVSADFSGCIKVFVHKAKPKHSSLPASALDRDASAVL